MESLPADICLKIFRSLDHQDLAAAQLVCRKWRNLGSDNTLWSNLFKERWGIDQAEFYAPVDSSSWKYIYIVQDRCDRVGLGLKIIREGYDYYLVHQGQIQRHLGSRLPDSQAFDSLVDENGYRKTEHIDVHGGNTSILDKILFFVGDLEAASSHVKRSRLM